MDDSVDLSGTNNYRRRRMKTERINFWRRSRYWLIVLFATACIAWTICVSRRQSLAIKVTFFRSLGARKAAINTLYLGSTYGQLVSAESQPPPIDALTNVQGILCQSVINEISELKKGGCAPKDWLRIRVEFHFLFDAMFRSGHISLFNEDFFRLMDGSMSDWDTGCLACENKRFYPSLVILECLGRRASEFSAEQWSWYMQSLAAELTYAQKNFRDLPEQSVRIVKTLRGLCRLQGLRVPGRIEKLGSLIPSTLVDRHSYCLLLYLLRPNECVDGDEIDESTWGLPIGQYRQVAIPFHRRLLSRTDQSKYTNEQFDLAPRICGSCGEIGHFLATH